MCRQNGTGLGLRPPPPYAGISDPLSVPRSRHPRGSMPMVAMATDAGGEPPVYLPAVFMLGLGLGSPSVAGVAKYYGNSREEMIVFHLMSRVVGLSWRTVWILRIFENM